jgi:nitrite reductase/ring-hydroxylating ferredoxin subunit
MAWEKVMEETLLPAGARQVVDAGGKKFLMLNHCDKVFAISTTCPHWGLPLELGRLTDDCGIVCPWHRSGFDLETGDIKAWAPWPPGFGVVLGATSRKKVLPTYPTKVEDGNIWVQTELEGESESFSVPTPPKPVVKPATPSESSGPKVP